MSGLSGAVEHASSFSGQERASNGYESDGEAMVSSSAVYNELVWMNGIDKGFQRNEGDIDVRTEGLAQLMKGSQAEVTARYDARVEAVQHMVKETARKAQAEEMKRKAEAAEREADAARVAKLEAEVARLSADVARAAEPEAQTDESEDEWAFWNPAKTKKKNG